MTMAEQPATRAIGRVGEVAYLLVAGVGDVTAFATRTLGWLLWRGAGRGTLLPACYSVGVLSMPVVAITGMFIGMVLAVQTYASFRQAGLETHLGGIINISIVREFGPVLAAVMLAGRVGGAMAAELATMRITEQVDALTCLGANPLHHLVVPRLVACVLLIPLLTLFADFMGILGGALISIELFHVEAYHYWQNARGFVDGYDLATSMLKPLFFGAAIAVIACHRGLNSRPGAQGVGQAATEAFVTSFVVIMVLDFFLGMFANNLRQVLLPDSHHGLI